MQNNTTTTKNPYVRENLKKGAANHKLINNLLSAILTDARICEDHIDEGCKVPARYKVRYSCQMFIRQVLPVAVKEAVLEAVAARGYMVTQDEDGSRLWLTLKIEG